MVGPVVASAPGKEAQAVFCLSRARELSCKPVARYTDRLSRKEHRGFQPVAIEERKTMLARAAVVVSEHFTADGKDRPKKLIEGGRLVQSGAFQAITAFSRRQ